MRKNYTSPLFEEVVLTTEDILDTSNFVPGQGFGGDNIEGSQDKFDGGDGESSEWIF